MNGSPSSPPEPAADAPCDVLVIGGAGFIGSHLVERLVADGVAVDVVDDLSTGTLGNLADARNAARQQGSPLRINTLDAASPELGELIALRRPAQVVHLATLVPGRRSPVELGRSFTSTLAVLEAARASGVDKVVIVLPATAMHGNPTSRDLPAKEGSIVPRGLRGRGRQVARRPARPLSRAARRRVQRPGHVVGVRQPAARRRRGGGGPRRRPRREASRRGSPATAARRATSCTSTTWSTRSSAPASAGSGLVVNVGTGVQTSLRDLAALVARDSPPPSFVAARPDELVRFSVSSVRARIHLGWAPWTALADGVEQLR